MIVDKKDALLSSIIANSGTYDPFSIRTFGRFVKKGDVVLNLGAHIGL